MKKSNRQQWSSKLRNGEAYMEASKGSGVYDTHTGGVIVEPRGDATTNPFPAPGGDPLLLAGAADLRRQCDELRGLVREAIPYVWDGMSELSGEREAACEDWLRRAQEAAR